MENMAPTPPTPLPGEGVDASVPLTSREAQSSSRHAWALNTPRASPERAAAVVVDACRSMRGAGRRRSEGDTAQTLALQAQLASSLARDRTAPGVVGVVVGVGVGVGEEVGEAVVVSLGEEEVVKVGYTLVWEGVRVGGAVPLMLTLPEPLPPPPPPPPPELGEGKWERLGEVESEGPPPPAPGEAVPAAPPPLEGETVVERESCKGVGVDASLREGEVEREIEGEGDDEPRPL